MDIKQIPNDDSLESIKSREKIIRKFYCEWKENNPSQRKYNLSTLAVLQLDSILTGAKKISIQKTKSNSKNQKSFERIMIMEYQLAFIGRVKMTVSIRRRTKEKVQYCITAIRNV